MKEFKDLEFKELNSPFRIGKISQLKFANGYAISVTSTNYSYGGNSGLYEIAVLDKEGEITYDTPITDNVVGWLDEDEVTSYMKQIQEL